MRNVICYTKTSKKFETLDATAIVVKFERILRFFFLRVLRLAKNYTSLFIHIFFLNVILYRVTKRYLSRIYIIFHDILWNWNRTGAAANLLIAEGCLINGHNVESLRCTMVLDGSLAASATSKQDHFTVVTKQSGESRLGYVDYFIN